MANANAPRGLVPVRGVNSQYVTGGLRQYAHDSGDATAIYVGDPIKRTGANSTINGVSCPNVIRAVSGDIIDGVVVGIIPVTRESLPYGAASTTYALLVDDDPNSMFEIQDVSGGTQLTANDVGLNVNFTGTGGNNGNGWSNVVLDNTTEATTNTLDLKIVDVVNRADNTLDDTGPLKFLVRINRHRNANQIAGI